MKQPGGFVNDGADGLFVDKAVKECRTPIVKAFLGGGAAFAAAAGVSATLRLVVQRSHRMLSTRKAQDVLYHLPTTFRAKRHVSRKF